jgi:L-alanine-DL-glutamate epimerase-like enolase superfamily enzyme
MKITEIEIMPVSIPTIIPYTLSFGTITEATSVLIKLHTDNGLYGIGDTSPCPTFSEESPESVFSTLKNYLFPAIKGMDPLNIGLIHQRMDQTVKGNPFAKAAIGIALYDILGKYFNVPIYKLLGGCYRKEFPLLWPLMGADAQTNVKEAKNAVKRGFRSMFIKVGHNNLDIDIDVERVAAVRKAVGDEVIIVPDANQGQGWTLQIAIQFIRKVEPYNVAWVEQPVSRWDFDGLARIRKAVNTPISADESLCSIYDAMILAKRDAVDIASIKLQKSEGFYKAKKIAAIMESANIPVYINAMIETGGSVAASLQFAVSIRNVIPFSAALMSTLRLQDDILKEGSLCIKNGVITVTDRPGLGVELDEQKIARYEYKTKSSKKELQK